MGKKIKKRRKIKKKAGLYLSIFLLFIIIGIGIVSFFIYRSLTLKDMKKHYNKYMITTKKTHLYNKNKKEIGTIAKNFSLELDKLGKSYNRYLKVMNSNYYIDYKDLKKTMDIKTEQSKDYYIPLNKNIKTKNDIILYSENKPTITLSDNVSLPIYSIDDENYYTYLFGRLFNIKKNKTIKEVNHKNTKDKACDYISILYYEKIEDNCSGDYTCTSINNLKEQLTKIKENGYYTIDSYDYLNYLNKKATLKEKAIYIVSNSESEALTDLGNELGLKINKPEETIKLDFTNKKSTTESNKEKIDAYSIKSYTSIDNIIKMANGEEVVEAAPVINKKQAIAVLNYHFFYDASKGEECGESICLEVSKFREQLNYLRDNNYKTLTMNEFKRWMYGEIELPEKSVLITIDDGAKGTGKHNGNILIPILEEYKMHATLFLIAGWWDIANYASPYLDIQSHTYDMHQYGSCGKGQINCATLDEAKADLQKSLDIIGNNDSFCFPFYYYSDTSLQAVKDLGFKLAFVGGMRKATRESNKYLIPRYPIHSTHTLQEFINMVS